MNLEVISREQASENMVQAMKEGNAEAFAEAMQAFGDKLALELKAQMEAETENRVLASRGERVLTKAEREFADGVKAMAKAKLEGTKMALSDTEVVMPETVVNKVFEDIKLEHPLLNEIEFVNTTYSTKWVMSRLTVQKAVWGPVDAEVTKELDASFLVMDMQLLSLTAFIPVSWALLDLGPNWIISYVVTMLKESIANSLEDGAINGKGNSLEPVGLTRDLTGKDRQNGGNLASQDFTSLEKSKKKVSKLDPKTIGEIRNILTMTPNGNRRVVGEVVIVVNPGDYETKVFPAITVQGTSGPYVRALPGNIRFVQSAFVNEGDAIAMIPKGYWMGLGQSGDAGRIEYSDDYKFLERKRYYMTSLYANGQPKDNNVSVMLDISALKPAAISVEVVTEKAE